MTSIRGAVVFTGLLLGAILLGAILLGAILLFGHPTLKTNTPEPAPITTLTCEVVQ